VQIEAGMAIMAKKPMLVLHERGIVEGIFDSRNRNDYVFGAELGGETAVAAFQRWLIAIAAAHARSLG
jgi:hypothetical protein